MKMALKIGNEEIISNDKTLSLISATDNITANTINNAIVAQNNVFIIYDSTGAEVRRFYCAAPPA